MNEILLNKRDSKKRLYVPNSGPGSWWLEDYAIDDAGPGTMAGYFGEVSSDEFITGDDLASAMSVTEGTSQNSDVNWLKFYIDGKILFVAKKSIRYSISWNSLDRASVVDGSEVSIIGNRAFRVRLFKGLNPDTSVPFSTGNDVPSTYNSEWNRLMYPVSIDVPAYPKTSQVIDNWANFPQDNSPDGLNTSTGNGRYTWCQEMLPNSSINHLYRGYGSVSYLGSISSSSSNTFLGWRPVLELVTEIIAPDRLWVYGEMPETLFPDQGIPLSPDNVGIALIPPRFNIDDYK